MAVVTAASLLSLRDSPKRVWGMTAQTAGVTVSTPATFVRGGVSCHKKTLDSGFCQSSAGAAQLAAG